jgi:hypothetical protein
MFMIMVLVMVNQVELAQGADLQPALSPGHASAVAVDSSPVVRVITLYPERVSVRVPLSESGGLSAW